MNLGRMLKEGFIAGLIGAASVAIWFLAVDAMAGQAFFTPAMLGSAAFLGVRDAAEVQIAFPTVIMYTALHVFAFAMAGMVIASLAALVDKFPTTLFLVVVFFAVFEFGFYVVVAVVASPLLPTLALTNVAIGNLIAAAGMGYYLWRAHPHIREALALHPLGETPDGE